MSPNAANNGFADTFQLFHKCPNQTCLVLAFVTYWTGHAPGYWPICELCHRCLTEPAEWYAPLQPLGILCASCEKSPSYVPNRERFLAEIIAGRPGTKNLTPNKSAVRTTGLFNKAKAAFTVEQIAGEHTSLRRASPGKLKGCCPLHQERTPSFYVYTDTDTWRCFGACAEGGDVIRLTQRLMDLGVAK
jgi:hypothetical protein